MIPLSYQFYASLVLVSVLGGVGTFFLTLVTLYSIGGIELVFAMLFLSCFGLIRIVLPSLSQTASDHYSPFSGFWEEKKIEDFAIETFVLEEKTEMIDTCSCCPICLSEYQTGDKVSIICACKHAYHTDCLKLWLPRSKSCPYCRSDFELKCTDQPTSLEIGKNGAWGVLEGIFESASVAPSTYSS
jgi:hypothetical protein